MANEFESLGLETSILLCVEQHMLFLSVINSYRVKLDTKLLMHTRCSTHFLNDRKLTNVVFYLVYYTIMEEAAEVNPFQMLEKSIFNSVYVCDYL